MARSTSRLGESKRHDVLGAGQGQQSQQPRHLPAETTAADQHQAVDKVRMLVGELHCHSPAERVSDDGHALDSEDREEVTEPARERSERVVARRFGGLAVAEQVDSDHVGVRSQERDHVVPCLGAPGEPVDQQDRLARTSAAIPHRVAVDRHVLERQSLGSRFQYRRPGARSGRAERTKMPDPGSVDDRRLALHSDQEAQS